MILIDNLISYYGMDETSGTTAVDSVGGNNGTITGPTINQAGINNKCYLFDGSNDYVDLTNTSELNLNRSFSISAWVKADTAGGSYRAYYSRDKLISGAGFLLGYYANTRRIGITQPYSPEISLYTDTDIPTGWNHVVITVGAGSTADVKIYVNGELKKSGTTSATLSYSAKSVIGSDIEGTIGRWSGNIDELSIWNEEMTLTKVEELYNLGLGKFYPFYKELISKRIYLNETNVSYATMNITTTSDISNFTLYLSNQSNSDWENVTNGLIHTFTDSTGKEVRYRILGYLPGSKITKVQVIINK